MVVQESPINHVTRSRGRVLQDVLVPVAGRLEIVQTLVFVQFVTCTAKGRGWTVVGAWLDRGVCGYLEGYLTIDYNHNMHTDKDVTRLKI